MEVFNENVYGSQTHFNLKNKVSTNTNTASKKHALTDVKNVLHSKEISKPREIQRNLLEEFCKSESKVVPRESEIDGYTMDELFFSTCNCSDKIPEYDWLDTVPDELRLTNEEICMLATRWGDTKRSIECDSPTLSPVKNFDDVLNDLLQVEQPSITESQSFLNLLNETCEEVGIDFDEDLDFE